MRNINETRASLKNHASLYVKDVVCLISHLHQSIANEKTRLSELIFHEFPSQYYIQDCKLKIECLETSLKQQNKIFDLLKKTTKPVSDSQISDLIKEIVFEIDENIQAASILLTMWNNKIEGLKSQTMECKSVLDFTYYLKDSCEIDYIHKKIHNLNEFRKTMGDFRSDIYGLVHRDEWKKQ